jgi:hypothetical protein
MAQRKQEKVNSYDIQKNLQRVDKLFRDLENDKSLPTFGEHFMQCLLSGTAENVNLKKMYPKTYFKLSKWLDEHNSDIETTRIR